MYELTQEKADELVVEQGARIEIPDRYTSISKNAFSGKQLTSATIPDGVTTIGNYAFTDNLLTSIDIPDNVTSIGIYSFYSNQLTHIDIPGNVTRIDDYSFSDNQLTNIIIPDSVTTIGNYAFSNNQLTSITLPDSVATISQGAFSDNRLTSVAIPDSVTTIGRNAFSGNRLTSIVIPDSVTTIGQGAFSGNELENKSTLKTISISKDATFDLLALPRNVEIIIRGDDDEPTGLLVSESSFDEKITGGSEIAKLSFSGPLSESNITYFLTTFGGIDNNAFYIDGNQLKIINSPDFETKSSYFIRLQASDSKGLTFEKAFTFTVNDLNESPFDILVLASTFDEKIKSGSIVATLSSKDPDSDETFTYALVSGDGDSDNKAFTIDGDQLKIINSPDFDIKSSYSIRLQTTDPVGLTFEKAFTFAVNNVNSSPLDLSVSASNFDEKIKSGSIVATLSSKDPDSDETFTYALVSGDGDSDNKAFTIDGDQLKIINSPDFDIKSSYSIRLQTTDPVGLTFEKAFTFAVNNVNSSPLDLSVSASNFDEKIKSGSIVATLSSKDLDSDETFTYALVSGDGDSDNKAFTIDGDQLKIINSPDFDIKSSYSIRLQTTDSGYLSFAKSFSLMVNELKEIPTSNPKPTSGPLPTPSSTDALPTDISDYEVEDIATLTPDAASELTADQVRNLHPSSFQGFTAGQVSKLSSNVMAAFSIKQLKQLNPEAVAGLSKDQISALPPKSIKGFDSEHLKSLRKPSFKALEIAQLTNLRKNAISGLTQSQLKTLSGDELSIFTPKKIKQIDPDAIVGLKPKALDELTNRQAKAFTDDQLAGLSKKQIKKADQFIDALSDQQVDALSFDPNRFKRLVNPLDNPSDGALPGINSDN